MARWTNYCLPVLVCCGTLSVANAQELNWAQKMLEKQTHDFGVVARGSDVIYKLPVTNIWQQDVQIGNVRTSCGCVSAQKTKEVLHSRESAFIEITLNTRQYSGNRNATVIVQFSSPMFVEVHIPIRAYIRTDVVFDPGSVAFGAIQQGELVERRVKIDYAGRGNWQILDVESKNPELKPHLKEVARDRSGRVQYELLVTATPKLEVGEIRDQITLITNDENSPRIPLLVEGRVDPEFLVVPSPIALGSLKPGEQKQVQIVVRARKPFAIDKIESDSGSSAYEIRLPDKTKQSLVHVLPLTVVAPEKPGMLTERFTLSVAGGEKTVEVKLVGKVLGAEGAENSAPMPVTTARPVR